MSDTNRYTGMPLRHSVGGSQEDVTAEVRSFYEAIQFPGTRPMEQDSLVFLRKFDRLVTAMRKDGRDVRVLDAGCGTGNTTLSLAAQFPAVTFTGVDLSGSSIERAKCGVAAHGLWNAEFYRWNLLHPLRHEKPFDIILCFGALHHTADMHTALGNISAVLGDEGSMFLWVYGAYGRYRHVLNMELLAMLLGADPTDDAVAVAREFIQAAGDNMAARDLLGERSADPLLRTFFEDATWIADQFLNPNEYSLTFRVILALLQSSGLNMEEWIGAPKDISVLLRSDELRRRYYLMSSDEQLIACDLLLKPDRYFLMLGKKSGG
ncbi:MAG: methyltransferase domain-containing protein [Bacteroidia bacterium]|nr:methyltransferase domain-containing protein [Bacteroidia bacterium]